MKKLFIILICLLGFTSLSFAKDVFPTYGKGKVEIRVYTDYFCGPCQLTEPDASALLRELYKKKKVKVTFVDMPYHENSMNYLKYFLFAVKENKNFEDILKIREILFNSAKREVVKTENDLSGLFWRKEIKYSTFDLKPIYDKFMELAKKDKISSTPTFVIEKNGESKKYVGGEAIVKALQEIK